MIDRAMIFGLIGSVGALIFIIELVRQRKLREDYSLLWLATAIVLLVLSLSRPLLDQIAAMLGVITYPPAALFVVAIGFMLCILLHFSTVVTRLARENKAIAQEMALLRWELTETKKALDASGGGDVAGDDQNDQQHGAEG
jgi:hypothetical protein